MSTLPWFTGAANKDNTSQSETHDFLAPVYAAVLSITPTKRKTLVQGGTLTGAQTINLVLPTAAADSKPPFVGDTLEFLFVASAGGPFVVTFGTGFQSSGTLSVAASKFGKATFTFDGVRFVGSGVATA